MKSPRRPLCAKSRCYGCLNIITLSFLKRRLRGKTKTKVTEVGRAACILCSNTLRRTCLRSSKRIMLGLTPAVWGSLYIRWWRASLSATEITSFTEMSSLRICWLTLPIILSKFAISGFQDSSRKTSKGQNLKVARWQITWQRDGIALQSSCWATQTMVMKLTCGPLAVLWASSVTANLYSLVILKWICCIWFKKFWDP